MALYTQVVLISSPGNRSKAGVCLEGEKTKKEKCFFYLEFIATHTRRVGFQNVQECLLYSGCILY